MKFRSICAKCNNELLGHLYDPELIRFTDEVSLFLRARTEHNLRFPPKQTFEVKPQKLLRSLVGHTLAGFIIDDKKNQPVEAPFPNALRTYFLDPTQPVPEKLKVFYWLYPSSSQVIIRGFGLMSLNFKGMILGDLIKFFPVAYWIVWDKPAHLKINHSELAARKDMSIEDTEKLTIDFQRIPDVRWPENPADDHMILLCNQSASFSTVRKIKRNRYPVTQSR